MGVNPRRNDWTNPLDQYRAPAKWLFGDDFDAPVPFDPQSGTTVLSRAPVVDDECYMGKGGSFTECVDFDPPARTRSANAHDRARAAPRWTRSAQDMFANIIKE